MQAKALAGVFLIGILAACESPYEQGVQRVAIPGGGDVYFKRETAGANSDLLGLTADGNPCHRLDESRDYVFPELGPLTAYYELAQGTLTIYSSSALRAPAATTLPVRVKSVVLPPGEFQELGRTYQARGLTKVAVEVSPGGC
jgi:hypothetical protein